MSNKWYFLSCFFDSNKVYKIGYGFLKVFYAALCVNNYQLVKSLFYYNSNYYVSNRIVFLPFGTSLNWIYFILNGVGIDVLWEIFNCLIILMVILLTRGDSIWYTI